MKYIVLRKLEQKNLHNPLKVLLKKKKERAANQLSDYWLFRVPKILRKFLLFSDVLFLTHFRSQCTCFLTPPRPPCAIIYIVENFQSFPSVLTSLSLFFVSTENLAINFVIFNLTSKRKKDQMINRYFSSDACKLDTAKFQDSSGIVYIEVL